jgi:hypothetical protein
MADYLTCWDGIPCTWSNSNEYRDYTDIFRMTCKRCLKVSKPRVLRDGSWRMPRIDVTVASIRMERFVRRAA